MESELDEVQRLAKIVDGLTLLTKADAGQIALAREPVRLDELVREACADAQSLARPHDIQVSVTACEELTVTGDRHRLRQLLLNLTDNAIKYNAPQGNGHPAACAGRAKPPNWPSPTRARAFRRRFCRASSTPSFAATPVTARPWKGAVWA